MDLDQDARTPAPSTRRRGAELEAALLDAAWDELYEKGYNGFTFDSVADRARTSRTVIYRRWPEREALMVAAIKHHLAGRRPNIPDTGSLRGDLLALLMESGMRTGELTPVIGVLLGGYYSATGETIAQIRERIIEPGKPNVDIVLERARLRGEHVPAQLPERVKWLPYDLLRHEVLMSMKPPTDEFIVSVVDDVIMPLIESYAVREDAAGGPSADYTSPAHPAD